MKLKEIYKNGCRYKTKKYGVVKVVNDPSQFKAYKKMGLDVFEKEEVKKDAKKTNKEVKK